MNSFSQPDRVFPLSAGSAGRPPLRAPRLAVQIKGSSVVMGNRAFMRAWAARRAAKFARPTEAGGLPGK